MIEISIPKPNVAGVYGPYTTFKANDELPDGLEVNEETGEIQGVMQQAEDNYVVSFVVTACNDGEKLCKESNTVSITFTSIKFMTIRFILQ